MEKRTILAFVLSFIILIGWSIFFGPKERQMPKGGGIAPRETPAETSPQASRLTELTSSGPSQVSVETAGKKITEAAAEKEVEINTPLYRAIFSNVGPTIKSFKLKNYYETTAADSPLVELVNIRDGKGRFLLADFKAPSSTQPGDTVYHVDEEAIQLGRDSAPKDLVFSSTTPDGLMIKQTFRFYPDQYRVDLAIDATNQSERQVRGAFSAGLEVMPREKKGYYSFVGLAVLQNDKLEELETDDLSEETVLKGRIGWMAYENDYFMFAIVPEMPSKGVFEGRLLKSGLLKGTYLPPFIDLNPSQGASYRYELYLGPRDLSILKQFGYGLDQAVNFGWTDIIARPLLYVLHFFYKYIHNYGVSIILLTLCVKILFWPLTRKSYKSMKEMQKLQPRMAKIREKHKNDKQKMNQEMMALYKTYKVNPMGGCLPMVIQLPVFFALFRVLGSSIELRHAPFILWINDLSAPDRLFNFPFEIPFMTPPYGIPVLTLLMGASMFIQQKMTPTPGDPAQAKIMMFLPIIFTFMFINFPSGLVLYWLVNNLLSIGQQYSIHKRPA
jgi:YidC/Oxa1 family membrane protein insertase